MQITDNFLLWLKLNVYSLLLCLMACGILLGFFLFPALRVWWLYLIAIPAVLALLKKAEDIFRRYSYKVKVYRALIRRTKKKFDQRYFVPYMGTACMRLVVYWSLVETNHKNEYSKIKKTFAEECNKHLAVRLVADDPKIVQVSMKQGNLHFQTLDH